MKVMQTMGTLTTLLLAIAGAEAQEPELLRAPVTGGELAYEIRGNGEPVLLIQPGGGGMSAAAGQQFQPWIPGAELVVVPTVGHAMQTQDLEAVGAAIADFIHRHPM